MSVINVAVLSTVNIYGTERLKMVPYDLWDNTKENYATFPSYRISFRSGVGNFKLAGRIRPASSFDTATTRGLEIQ